MKVTTGGRIVRSRIEMRWIEMDKGTKWNENEMERNQTEEQHVKTRWRGELLPDYHVCNDNKVTARLDPVSEANSAGFVEPLPSVAIH